MGRKKNYGGVQNTGATQNGYSTEYHNQGQQLTPITDVQGQQTVPIANIQGGSFQLQGNAGGGEGGGRYHSNRNGGKPSHGPRGEYFNVNAAQAQIDKQHQLQQRNKPGKTNNELVTIVVKGVLESAAANEGDNGLTKCREWLEEWANRGKKPIDHVSLRYPKWDGNDATFKVEESKAWIIEKSNRKFFERVKVSVQRADRQSKDTRSSTHNTTTVTMSAAEKTEILKAFLSERYDAENKTLRLDYLGLDPRLNEIGTWDPTATRHKHTDFFPALMRLCENAFPSKAEKAEQIQSVSLANNDLTDMAPVLELAKAFPDLRNLDLSKNKIKDLRALDLFRYKFQNLDWLVVAPNPIEFEDPEYERTILGWYPALRTLNTNRVRSDEVASSATLNATPSSQLPLATIKDNFQDEAGIAESAIKDLFKGTDNDRPALARSLYDNESTFSLSYNPSAPRLDTAQPASWEPHLKQSRNLKKVFQLEPRIRRMAKGISEIETALKILPPTRHPDLINESLKYSFDCTPIPGVPDPHNRIEAGVGGFQVNVHGSFEEYDRNTGFKNATRSFDRVFVLGPGAGENTLRIVSDILMLRAEGGYEAFNPEQKAMPDLPMVTKNFGFPPNTEAEVEVKQAFVAGEVSQATGLTLELATQLLNESRWDFEAARENFKIARQKGLLRNHWFMPEMHPAAVSNPTGIFY